MSQRTLLLIKNLCPTRAGDCQVYDGIRGYAPVLTPIVE